MPGVLTVKIPVEGFIPSVLTLQELKVMTPSCVKGSVRWHAKAGGRPETVIIGIDTKRKV